MKPHFNLLRLPQKACVFLISGILLSACQTNWQVEPNFGSSVNDAVKMQLVNSQVGDPSEIGGLDGGAAKSAIDNYQKSLEMKSNSGAYPGGGALSPTNSTNSGMVR